MKKRFPTTVRAYATLAIAGWAICIPPAFADAPSISPLLPAPSSDITRARDPADGSWVSGGGVEVRRAACSVASQAFIERHDENGELHWRRDSKELFAQLSSIDPRYLLASAIRDLIFDPGSGDVLAAADVALGWATPGKAADTMSTMSTLLTHGIVVLRLDRSGAPVADAYLGERPAGEPAGACGNAVLDSRNPLSATRLQIDLDGAVTAIGKRRGSVSASEGFFTRLSSFDLTKLMPSAPSPKAVCAGLSGHLVSLVAIGGTVLTGSDGSLVNADSCELTVNPGTQSEEGFVVEYEFPRFPVTPTRTIHIGARYQAGGRDPLEIYLRNTSGAWVHISTVQPDPEGHFAHSATFSSGPYMSTQNRIQMKITMTGNVGFVDDDIDFDCGGID